MRLRKLVTMRQALESQAYFGGLLAGKSWAAWRILLIAMVGEELTEDERVTFTALTGRNSEPLEPIEEFWGIVGRRGGKSRAMAILAAWLAACCDHRAVLAPGERGVLPIMAASVVQAASSFAFISGAFRASPHLRDLVETETADTLSLSTGVDVSVRPASFRTIRGVSAVGAICDEIAFWRSDDSANPDREIIKALRPSLATTAGPLICISSPHAKRGELYSTFKRHFGSAGHPSILVAKAPSRVMNPGLSQRVVDRAYEEDPEAASAEYGAEFRGDLAIFVSRDAIEAAVTSGVIVRPPIEGVTYFGFVDPSGGSSDSMTMAVAHNEKERVVLDCIGDRKAPFSPEAVVTEFAALLKSYRITTVEGDRYAGEWPRERFGTHGITYRVADKVRSELYLAFLPMLNSGRLDLLDNQRMVAQFVGLERRTSRAGKDTVDYSPGSHDDVANSVAGALAMLASDREPGFIGFYRSEVERMRGGQTAVRHVEIEMRTPPWASARGLSGRDYQADERGVIVVDPEDVPAFRKAGFVELGA